MHKYSKCDMKEPLFIVSKTDLNDVTVINWLPHSLEALC